MKKFFMAIVLCLVCTVSFGQEQTYIKYNGSVDSLINNDYQFIIAKKLNGKNICIFSGEFDEYGGSTPIILKMLTDSTILCHDSLSFCILGESVMRNKDFKYMGLKSTGTNMYSYGKFAGYNSCGSYIINFIDEYTNVNINKNTENNFIFLFRNSDHYIWIQYYKYSNIFCSTEISGLSKDYIIDEVSNLEIYIEYKSTNDSVSTSVYDIMSDVNYDNTNTIKCIKNGKLIIQKDGKTYDILGNQIY